MTPAMGLLRATALVLGMALAALVTAQGSPDSKISSFDNLPMRLFLLDDTDTAFYHDRIEGNVYVSLDEGRNWKAADGIPSGVVELVVEHPFDNRFAFALTDGETHYRSEDRGKTWRSFKVPAPPASVARPLVFHSDPSKYGYVLYQGTKCERSGWGGVCRDETYYTKEAFGDDVELLLSDTTHCQFAHSSKDFKHEAHSDLIYCVAFDTSGNNGRPDLSTSKLFSSTNFFEDGKRSLEDLGIGKKAKGVIAFAIVSKYAVVALKDTVDGEMTLYVTYDTKTWAKAHFPHASSAKLRENAYTMLESTTHSLAVDVVLQDNGSVGTLFISNSNGTYFVESLKDTNRNDAGYVDYERLYGVEGIGLANIVANAGEVENRKGKKKLQTRITFNDGSSWRPIRAPDRDVKGDRFKCDVSDLDNCSLHFHSVTAPHNFGRIFSSPAPGFVMGVGSVGSYLRSYEESDTFLSVDGGLTWKMVSKDAHKYEFGDAGSILVIVNDEEATDEIKYSLDLGKTWQKYDLGIKIHAKALTTLPDSTSQKFLLLGTVPKAEQKKHDVGRAAIIFLDFSKTRKRKCKEDDFEKWYAREGGEEDSECLMGHRQWYKRRKPDADCYVGEKFRDPVNHEDKCKCTDADFECDYNFVRNGKECVPVGPEPIPAGICADPNQTYMGSSGFRKIPGNTCEGGIDKDKKKEKKCSEAQPKEGEIIHQTFQFPAAIVQHAYFKDSKTILVRLEDFSMWQSLNEGYTWQHLFPDRRFLAFYHHKFTSDRAFLITDNEQYFSTTTGGRSWDPVDAPLPPNTFGAQVLRFHPTNSDLIIWVGNKGCRGASEGENCHAEAHYSRDNGRNWVFIESYVRNCAFAVDSHLNADPTEILCESYRDKKGSQKYGAPQNEMELVTGTNYYSKKKKIFDSVVGFAKFSEFLVVAEMVVDSRTLKIQVSLDGTHFATGQFPPTMSPETHAYTILESNTKSLFLHMTTSEAPAPYWGAILKSNSNGTYFGLSLDHVNRNEAGYIDFEKMIGLDGIALVNVVSNTEEALHSGVKKIQSRITHNDGGTWKTLTPPRLDSQGNEYECDHAKCALHVHGYTERIDPRATYSSPSVVGLLMAVGNVGESLARYDESDTFLSRDGGFTWTEIHKDAHLWEFGDSGSVLIIANDEEPTNYVTFSTDEGLTWREYTFSDTKMKVMTIVTVPSDTSRRFILFGYHPRSRKAIAVHLDFSMLTTRQCTINVEDPGNDDFELWSPAENREEQCLFGRQTLYHRRTRSANCVVGTQPKAATTIKRNCPCTKADFECEFNYVKDSNDECVLVPGTSPLPDDPIAGCSNGEDYWYERTAYRLIPYSTCEDGERPDRGKEHACPGFKSKGAWFWMFMLLLPFGFTALVGYYYWRKSGMARGTIRLPGEATRSGPSSGSGALETLASVPWFLIGVAGIAYEWVASRVEERFFNSRRGYRNVPIDEDAQILRFEDEE